MTAYLVDAVGMLRYLVDALPDEADEAFYRAEQGVDSIRSTDVQIAEVLYQVSRSQEVAGIELEGTPNEALRLLVADGPVDIASIDEQVLAVYGSISDVYTMHDGLLIAAHRVLGTDSIISKDEDFSKVETVWE